MHENIQVIFDRADEIMVELEREYAGSLAKQEVSARTMQLCHDLFEKLRSALDRSARRYFEIHVAPKISDEDRKAATIYFPIAADEHSFSSIMGRWRWKSVRDQHKPFEDYLSRLQPYSNLDNKWLDQLSNLCNEGKHIDLSPQRRTEARQVTLTSPQGGSISYGPGVVFGGGVSLLGVPVDPATQRVVHNNFLTENIVIWVDFTFSKYGNSALGFSKESLLRTKAIATEMSGKFGV